MVVPGPGTRDGGGLTMMKSQDLGLLLKLISMESTYLNPPGTLKALSGLPDDWQDWEIGDQYENEARGQEFAYLGTLLPKDNNDLSDLYSVRSLAHETGISKSQVSLALKRIFDVGLAVKDRQYGYPKANTKALYEFIVYGLRYVFPAKPGEMTRGIATSVGAPVLANKLMTAGDTIPVWPDARGSTKGVSVEPLFKSVTYAVRRDHEMYAMLALIDAIRIGHAREREYAQGLLAKYLRVRE